MVLMVNNLSGFGGGGEQKDFRFVSSTSNTANLSTYTFTAQDIGTPSPSRRIVVALTTSSGVPPLFSSVTLAGNAMTLIDFNNDAGPTDVGAGIYYLAAPTGSTADIVVTFSASINSCKIFVYSIVAPTSFAVGSYNTDITNPLSLALPVAVGNAIVAVSCSDGTTPVWTAPLTENAYLSVETPSSTASLYPTVSSVETVAVSWTSSSGAVLCASCFVFS
jgi:hypothetical protein